MNSNLGKAHNGLAVSYFKLGFYSPANKNIQIAKTLDYNVAEDFILAVNKALAEMKKQSN